MTENTTNKTPLTFAQRSRLPRISTAATLAQCLENVLPLGRYPYTYSADAPCHTSHVPGHGDSFQFGDAVDIDGNFIGGLSLDCWGCIKGEGGPGAARGMVERIEDKLGRGLQVRWPAWDDADDADDNERTEEPGPLRYKYGALEIPGHRPPPRPAGAATRRKVSRIRRFGTQGPDTLTLKDLQEMKVWAVGRGAKKPWQQKSSGGRPPWCFRQSLAAKDGGMVVARFGGDGMQTLKVPAWAPPGTKPKRIPVRVIAWENLEVTTAWVNHRPHIAGILPVLSLGGDEDNHSPLDTMLIDLDYHPDLDVNGVGRAFRDALAETLAQAGAPLFASSSGNGFHCVVREDATFLREVAVTGTEVRYPRNGDPDIGGAAVVEMFPAGMKRLVLLRWEKPMFNTDPDTAIPVVSRDWLRGAILDARSKAEGKPAAAPPEWQKPRETARQEANEPAQEPQSAPWDPFDDFQDAFPGETPQGAPEPAPQEREETAPVAGNGDTGETVETPREPAAPAPAPVKAGRIPGKGTDHEGMIKHRGRWVFPYTEVGH